jgi:hypothetical protein
MFKHSDHTSKKSQHFSVTKTHWSVLVKDTTAVYTEKHMKLTVDGWLVVYLLYDAFWVTRLYGIDDRVTSEWWIRKNFVGSGRGLILRYYPGIRLEGLRKTTNSVTVAGLWGRDPTVNKMQS